MPELATWAGKAQFSYDGSVVQGTTITYGNCHRIFIDAQDYRNLLDHFGQRQVPCGCSRTEPPANSLGRWLMTHVTPTATASYVGPILVSEGYAIKNGEAIRFR